jgi:hypothetical protein
VTNQPQGRDDSPPVAALAVQVNRLRRDLDALSPKLDDLAATQHRHTTTLADVAQLWQQIEQILTILDTENDTSPARWFWLTMPADEREAKFSELHDWVETVLRQQYPDYLADHIKPCWPNHPEARWELTWLYQLWTLTYLTTRPTPKDAGDWHDRWTPGVIRRLSQIMANCQNGCGRPTVTQRQRSQTG